MKTRLIIVLLTIAGLFSCKQKSDSEKKKATIQPEPVYSTKNNNEKPPIDSVLERFTYTDTTYSFSQEERIIIQNSLPKGGMIAPGGAQYFDTSGKKYVFAVFWTRIINESSTPIELNIHIPADSFAIFNPPNSYLKLFLPPDKLTYDKLSSFNYGLTNIKSFLDINLNKATNLRKTIAPNNEYIFYVATLSYEATGTPRAALFMQKEALYYRMSLSPNGAGTIPLGKITFTKKANSNE
ncbi:hypothetical protein LVD15_01870 [Fulvivirga maritima]|uniref:hypothetical protein n=1 Tax=Fulvivirga maritima TaxID=2904247 RepID=UPI001F230D63|nr:hypothetical protein [Fulvivirga maritima]UII27197.1 hypothetical protein LVD15_01870 [Fulvivirga maritima]